MDWNGVVISLLLNGTSRLVAIGFIGNILGTWVAYGMFTGTFVGTIRSDNVGVGICTVRWLAVG